MKQGYKPRPQSHLLIFTAENFGVRAQVPESVRMFLLEYDSLKYLSWGIINPGAEQLAIDVEIEFE